jgi:hypothetical protein
MLPKEADQGRRLQFTRFRLWANGFYTPQGLLDKILSGSGNLEETVVVLLASLGSILITDAGEDFEGN